MTSSAHPKHPDQSFAGTERLLRRVRRDNIAPNGKPTLLAFALPDMSVNREKYSTPEEARKGHDKNDWAVVAFLVNDIPPRIDWVHLAQLYRLLARHVPEARSHAHSEVRVWRKVDAGWKLITNRLSADFDENDPDRSDSLAMPESWLDPEFHMRWRKHIALAAKMALPCEPQTKKAKR